ncbi:MAG: hypothetical protein VZR11_14330 [Succinimonas sp.]|nr:hypothetical protein [Succinimonas sp.]
MQYHPELLYIAITRAKDHLPVYASTSILKKPVRTRTEREAALTGDSASK